MPAPTGRVVNEVGDIANPKVIEIVVKALCAHNSLTVSPVINVYHYRGDDANTSPVKSSINSAFQSAVQSIVVAAIASAVYTDVTVNIRFLDDPTDAYEEFSGTPAVGTDDTLPLRDAVLIDLATGLRGRKYRGRKYYSPVVEDNTTKDELTTTADYETLTEALAEPITDGDDNIWYPIVLNVTDSDLTASPAIMSFAYIKEAFLRLNIRSLKRRREKIVST